VPVRLFEVSGTVPEGSADDVSGDVSGETSETDTETAIVRLGSADGGSSAEWLTISVGV
jgi:hypothetical protein